MNKRNFLKSCLLSLVVPLISFPFIKELLQNKIIIKKKHTKIWFLHIDDFR